MPKDTPEFIKKRLFRKVQAKRLATIPDIMQLPREQAEGLLSEALEHWDRRLRMASANECLAPPVGLLPV